MAIALVSPNGTATAGNASGGDLTITKPAGVANGQTMVVCLYSEFSDTAWTLPAGWAWWGGPTGQEMLVGATPSAWLYTAWKTASAEGANWTFTHAGTAWRIGAFASFSGAFTGGDPEDSSGPTGNQNAGSTSPILLSITTNSANDMLIGASGNFSGGTLGVGASGMSLAVQLGGCGIVYALQAGAGASGAKTLSVAPATNDWASWFQAIKPATVPVASNQRMALLGVGR